MRSKSSARKSTTKAPAAGAAASRKAPAATARKTATKAPAKPVASRASEKASLNGCTASIVAKPAVPARAKAPAKTPEFPLREDDYGKEWGAGDGAVRRATGRGWDEWMHLLDQAGCALKEHAEIAVLTASHGAGDWWSQMVTVGYERARGLRQKGETANGWQASASKTFDAPVGDLFRAFYDPKLRTRWLGEPITVRKATAPKSLRITWSDGRTHVDANLYAKGPTKSYVSLQHTKLADAAEVERAKTDWNVKLGRLKEMLEGT
ncbi:MAG TPA: hypothetical protein VEI02_08105 [Planctomycetota bacterium]|nr:hypothetical protein [Planctomycetota bacterium]